MSFRRVLLEIYRSDEVATAVRALVQPAGNSHPVHGAFWVRADRSIRQQWPPGAEATAELIETAFHIPHPEIVPLGSEFPVDAVNYPSSEVLVLPLRNQEMKEACLLFAPEGALGEDLDAWAELRDALESCGRREEERRSLRERVSDLQKRVEESEALHTLGLAANRTLDTEEVLRLVVRLTRTLLGADYVTVGTAETGRVHTAASVGLRNALGAADDYLLGRRVVEAEKPLILGPDHSNLPVREYPYHAAEGMQSGLGIPLSLFGETFGALVVGYRHRYEVSARDVRFGLTLAGHAAVAISNARLHERVEQRSQELELAYEELRNATNAKERFFASVNHELRNPIGAVMGYLSLVLEAPDASIPQPERGFIEKAFRSAATLNDLVNDLLDLSKIAAGKMQVELQPCALADIIAATVDIIQPLANSRGVPLHLSSTAGLPLVHTDAGRAQQILVNLLSNGLKFTGPGGVFLEFSVPPPVDSPGASVDVRVIDCGPGISPEDQHRIFEEFEQVAGTQGGTGLGLPVSRRLARLLGGDLLLESEAGMGSTFILRLPAAASASGDESSIL